MNYCPCCSSPLLRHIRSHEVYWFCRNCWQVMPVLSREKFACELHNPEKASTTVCLSKRKMITGWIGVQDVAMQLMPK